MGGSSEYPAFSKPAFASNGIKENLGAQGDKMLEDLQARSMQGLPAELKQLILQSGEDSANASLVTAKRLAKENLSGRQVPTGALVRTMADLTANKAKAMTELNKDVTLKDYEAKTANQDKLFSGYTALQGLANQTAGMKNTFNINSAEMENAYGAKKYEAEMANDFNWNQALTGLLGAGGTVGGAMIAKK